MKIALIPQIIINTVQPDLSDAHVPLGLLSLASSLNLKEHDVTIIDLTSMVRKGTIIPDAAFEENASRHILKGDFDLVGFSTSSPGYHWTLNVVSALKKISPRTIIILGGPQASFCARTTLEYFPADIVVRGEGESIFRELIGKLNAGASFERLKGITFRKGRKIVENAAATPVPDLDDLCFPAFEIYPDIMSAATIPLEGSRGSPYTCTYSSTCGYWGKNVRRKSALRILHEIKFVKEAFNPEYITFVDNVFTLNRKATIELCELIVSEKLDVKWRCKTRIDSIDSELLETMANAGCKGIFYGIESGSPKIQKQIKKNIDLGTVLKNCRSTVDRGMEVTASFIAGFPDETENDLEMTLKLGNNIKILSEKPLTVLFHVLAPDTNSEIALKNIDKLDHDGFHSDHLTGTCAAPDRNMILKHKQLFLPYYFIRTRHLKRREMINLHYFIFGTDLLAYWSTLYMMLADKSPLKFFREWSTHFDKHGGDYDHLFPKSATGEMRATFNLMNFLSKYFQESSSIPRAISDLFRHEFEMISQKGKISTNPASRRKAENSEVLIEMSYDYDPEITIEAIRRSVDEVKNLKKTPVKVQYFCSGYNKAGPVITYRKIN